ncbi:MAG: peptidase [Chloroflexi bacterium]|nr:MAG: peptidase [Chloroflexota bacterium]
MTKPQVSAYGSWKSPITSDMIVSSDLSLGEIVLAGESVYWIEGRPAENGRSALVKWSANNGLEDVVPSSYNIRSRVHEYGGSAYNVYDDVVYFVNFVDQQIYRQLPGQAPTALTAAPGMRYANLVLDKRRQRLLCVREDHTGEGEAITTLVAVDLNGEPGAGTILLSGNDFYSSPQISPDGTQFAWLTWHHPNMPWDGTELWLGQFDDNGQIEQPQLIAGSANESVFQPEWSPNGVLYFISDRSGWWNLYRWQDGMVQALLPMEAEFGIPQWRFGMSTYGFENANSIISSYTQDGTWYLTRINLENGECSPIPVPYSTIGGWGNVRVGAGHVVFCGSAADKPTSNVRLNLATNELQILQKATHISLPADIVCTPEAITFPTENGRFAHAFYYPPHNDAFQAPADEKPPVIVISHGGPTSATALKLSSRILYWTSRGIGVIDVNYGGSTGYGRSYRQRLNGQWGIVDVLDCINAAKYLVRQGRADGDRLAIMGGSAGGYTTLCALTFHDVFAAGISLFGVSDVEVLTKETHKFESRYLDSMIGPYPEAQDIYVARSPIHYTEQLNCPLLLFQGLEDKVVLPNQAEMMFEALKAKGVPVAYVPFAGEGHGFRKAENIKRTLDGTLYFLSKIFKFDIAADIEPLTIYNSTFTAKSA